MKVFYTIMVVMLLGALALPFFMHDGNDQPVMTGEKIVGNSVANIVPSDAVEMFRWQDQHGVWQFGENAPEQVVAVKMSLDDSRTTRMGPEWDVRAALGQSSSHDPVNFKMPNSLTNAYQAAPELLGAAQRAAKAMNARTGETTELLEKMKQAAN